MKRLFFIALLLLPTYSFEMDQGQWVRDWWDNTQSQRTKESQVIENCKSQIARYQQKVKENPSSTYYLNALKQWEVKCGHH